MEMENPSILVVDDETVYQELLSEYLQTRYVKDGVTVLVASNGEEAMEVVKKGGVDLVISDIHMPKMNGFDLYRKIKKENSEIEVVLMTGDKDANPQGIEEAGYYVIGKPFTSLSTIGEISDKALTKYGFLKKLEAEGSIVNEIMNLNDVVQNKILDQVQSHLSEETIDHLKDSTPNESQRRLVKNFSHEARGLLTILGGLVELVEEDIKLQQPEDKETANKLKTQLKRLGSLIEAFVREMRSTDCKKVPNMPHSETDPYAKKSMGDIMRGVSQVFKDVLFENKLTVEVNLPQRIEIPTEPGKKVKLILISLISHIVKVLEDCHMKIVAEEREGQLYTYTEIYSTEKDPEIKQLIESGFRDVKRLLNEVGGDLRVLQVNEYQVNVNFNLPIPKK